MAARRRAYRRTRRRAPSVAGRIFGWLGGEASGRHARESLERRRAAERARDAETAKSQSRISREMAMRDREQYAARIRRKREEELDLRIKRAAYNLRVAQDRAIAQAERMAAQAERARTRGAKDAAKAKQQTQEHKADDLADLERKVLAGEATGDQVRYWFEKSGAKAVKS